MVLQAPVLPEAPPVPMPDFAPIATGPSPEDVLDAVRQAMETIEAEVEKDTRPRYPKWLKVKGDGLKSTPPDYPRPNPDEALTFAREQWANHAELRNRFADDIAFITGNRTGTVFNDAKQDEKDSPYKDEGVQAEHELIVANLGAINPIYDPEVRQSSQNDEKMNKADFLLACDVEAERRHNMAGNGAMRIDTVRSELTYGRIIAQVMYSLDCEEGEIPIREHLLDPATCCPVFEDDRGMSHMVRFYSVSLRTAATAFNYDGEFRKKLEAHKGVTRNQPYKDTTTVEVIEYWDRWWRIVWVDSCLIVGPVAHRLGKPPFIFQLGALGLMAVTGTQQKTRDGLSTYALHDAAQVNKGLSHAHLWRVPVALRESMMARVLSQFRRSIDPAWLVEQDHIADDKGAPEISNAPNAMNTILKGHESLTQLPNLPDNATFGPLMQVVNDQIGRIGAPASAYGIGDAGNGSGFALENLNESGRDKFMPHLVTLQMFYQQLAERRLELFRDWGWMLKQGDEPYGKMQVARPKPLPMQQPQFVLTPGDIRRTGTRCKVRMTRVNRANMSQVANSIAILRNMNIGNPVMYYEILGYENPERQVLEDRYYQMMEDPALRRKELIDYLRANGEVDKAAYLEAQSQQEQPPGMMPTDQLSAGAEMTKPVSIQGASMPQFNQPPGPIQ